MVEHGADVNICDKLHGTPLHAALTVKGVPTEIVTQLMSEHSINSQNHDGSSPLHMAVREQVWGLVPVLLDHGADVNVCDCKVQTPLLVAVLEISLSMLSHSSSLHGTSMYRMSMGTLDSTLRSLVTDGIWCLCCYSMELMLIYRIITGIHHYTGPYIT